MATQRNEVVSGVKGITLLAQKIDLVKGVLVDYIMHAVLKGITRWLLLVWFDSTNHKEAFYLGLQLISIDNDLMSQKPPHEFSRSPGS